MLLAMTAWGASWPSGKMIADAAAPEVLIFWRFTLTFLTFIPIMILIKKPLKLDGKSLLQVALGSIFIIAYNKFYFTGLRYGLAGAGGVLVTTLNPIFTFLLMIIFFRQKISSRETVGILLGLTGGLILVEIWGISLNRLLLSGNLFFILAALSWASLSITSQRSGNYMSTLVFSFYVFGFAAVIDFFLALPCGILAPLKFGMVFWLNLVYLSLFATTFATTIYFFAAAKIGSHRASSYIFLVPFSAVLISWMVLDERPKISTILGGIIAVFAVYLINAGTRVYERIRSAPKP